MKSIPKAKALYSYFRDCYEADNRNLNIRSVFQSRYKLKHFVGGIEEVLEKKQRFSAFDHPKVEEVKEQLLLYSLEIGLYYGAFFLLGMNRSSFHRSTKIASPLFLIPAELMEGEEAVLDLGWDQLIINTEALRLLDLKNESKGHDEFLAKAEMILSQEGGVYSIKALLEEFYQNLDTEALVEWPKLWKSSKIQSTLKEIQLKDSFKVVPAAAYLLLEKNQNSLGVLQDLEFMAQSNAYPEVLKNLLETQTLKKPKLESWFRYQLNREQYKALQNTFQYPGSVIIGPPGTGKSYTIAAITAEAIAQGKSIMIASKTKSAVEVVRGILESKYDLKDYLIQSSGHGYRRSLLTRVRRFLRGIERRPGLTTNLTKLTEIDEQMKASESAYQRELERELRRLELEKPKSKKSLKRSIEKLWLSNVFRTYDLYLRHYIESLEIRKDIDKRIKKYSDQKIHLNRFQHRNSHRNAIAAYEQALESESFTESKKRMQELNYSKLLNIFPIWLVHLPELNNVLPQQLELFDLLIIDEASQVDLALALPAIYRAKHSCIVGDPNQLRHYSFLSQIKQAQLQKKHGLNSDSNYDYRNRSILDFFLSQLAEQDQLSFLREHFRSSPDIIEFSNQEFYAGQLEVLKSGPQHQQEDAIELHPCDGKRTKDGVNKIEGEALISKLKALQNEYKYQALKPSIGVLSPFSAQVSWLKTRVAEEFSREFIQGHDLWIGGPYHFQGSEREIMLLSFALDDNAHSAAYTHLNKAEVFNVSVTRAISKQIVFHSLNSIPSTSEHLLHRYLHFLGNRHKVARPAPEHDQFLAEIIGFLEGLETCESIHPAHPIAGMILDLIIKYKDKHIFIDLIGYPGDYALGFHMERYQTLSRIGIQSLPVFYSHWSRMPEEARKSLVNALYELSK